jgi:hypothetical protein
VQGDGAKAPEGGEAEGTISGWVVTSSGQYLAGAQVGASSEEGSVFVTSDSSGRFQLRGLPSEEMNVFATAVGFAPDHAHGVHSGTHDLMMVVDDPARISVTVAAAHLPHLFVRLCHQSEDFGREVCVKSEYSSPPASTVQLDRLPSGEFDLVFVSEERELLRRRVSLSPGEQLVVDDVAF